MSRDLDQADVAANLAPFQPHVERVFTASPRGSESSLLLVGPRGAELVSEDVGAEPAFSGATPSGVDDAGARPVTPSVANSQIRGEEGSGEAGTHRAGSLQREANRARAHDAIHSYLVEVAGYDINAAAPTFHKAVSALEALANNLASRTQAAQD